jgi:hypothetical protein
VITLDVPNRPFATEPWTGLMLPDGIFVTTLGSQGINAHFRNMGAAATPAASIYLESVDDPGITFTPATYPVGPLAGGAAALLSWRANFSGAAPGKHLISFIVSIPGGGKKRILKRIFLTRIGFDPVTKTFTADAPEGRLAVRFIDLVGPKNVCCCDKNRPADGKGDSRAFLADLARSFAINNPDFKLCIGGFLPHDLEVAITPTPPYAGQYGDLPFQDPFWKIILAIIAALLAIAAAIAEAVGGTGDLTVSGGTSGGGSDGSSDCCGVSVSGGGTSAVAAGLLAAAAAVAVVAAASDVRDPFRRGQDHTNPADGELTTAENLKMRISYLEPVVFGKPFAIGAKWDYTRVTTGQSYGYAVDEMQKNVHVLSKYEIDAPDVVRSYKREPFIVKAVFRGPDGKAYTGDDLFVLCFLIGPQGQLRSFRLEDNGAGGRFGDQVALDGIYTGGFQFTVDDRGLWTYLVIAQDVNDADPNLTPDQAAQIIGGMVLTGQLSITFDGGTCPLVPDGHVNVI